MQFDMEALIKRIWQTKLQAHPSRETHDPTKPCGKVTVQGLDFCEHHTYIGRVWIQGLKLFELELISSSKQSFNKIALDMFGSKSYLAF